MLKPYDPFDAYDETRPECRSTVARLQSVLDGDADAEALAADPHPAACAACRERVHAARVLLSVLAAPAEPAAVPAGFADRVVQAMKADRHVRSRRGVYKAAACLALAAAILLAVFAIFREPQRQMVETLPDPRLPAEVAQTPDVAPPPREKTPDPAPPIRVGDALANAGQALRDTPKPFADSVAVAPKLFDALTGPFTRPAPPADPMGAALEPARKSLTDLPVAARSSLEPVTGTAEKAFARFLRDVGAVKPNS